MMRIKARAVLHGFHGNHFFIVLKDAFLVGLVHNFGTMTTNSETVRY